MKDHRAVFSEKEIKLTNVDLDTLSDVAIMLNDIAEHEDVSIEIKKGQAKDALRMLNNVFKNTKMFE